MSLRGSFRVLGPVIGTVLRRGYLTPSAPVRSGLRTYTSQMASASETLAAYEKRVTLAEKSVVDLKKKIEEVSAAIGKPKGGSDSIEKLKLENAKLKYQMLHLKRNLDAELARGSASAPTKRPALEKYRYVPDDKHLPNMMEVVTGYFRNAIEAAYPGVDAPVSMTVSAQFADYQCNSAMPIAKLMKGKPDAPANPREAAQRIIDHLERTDIIGKVEIAGPGFINVHLTPSFAKKIVTDIVRKGVRPPNVPKKRVVVDFSSPNIAKEMHVGHLRSTIIGDCLCRLLEFYEFDVLRVNHVGDWGTQFGMLIAHLKDMFPDYETVSPPIGDLQAFYKASKKRFDEDADFKRRAYDHVVRLQSGDASVTRGWKLICDVSRNEFQRIYDRLQVRIEERGESFYQPLMAPAVVDCESKGLVVVEEGRKVLFVEGQIVPLTLVKSDGGYTYDTSDLAALRYRVNELKADWVVYVVDQGQALHFELIFAAAAKAGYFDPRVSRIEHVGFGVVLGEDHKKFKTRSGDTVRLVDLLDESLDRALAVLKEKGRDKELSAEELHRAQTAVAYGAVKYADLSCGRQNDYVFSFDRMLSLKGNTAAYLLYAFTRIRSIARKAGIDVQTNAEFLATEADPQNDHEIKLAKHLLRFSEVTSKVLDTFMPHVLCDYLYNLSDIFTEFYDHCRVLDGDKVHMPRLVLCEATAMVMGKGFEILGLTPVDRM
eukprot:Opistho-2@18489